MGAGTQTTDRRQPHLALRTCGCGGPTKHGFCASRSNHPGHRNRRKKRRTATSGGEDDGSSCRGFCQMPRARVAGVEDFWDVDFLDASHCPALGRELNSPKHFDAAQPRLHRYLQGDVLCEFATISSCSVFGVGLGPPEAAVKAFTLFSPSSREERLNPRQERWWRVLRKFPCELQAVLNLEMCTMVAFAFCWVVSTAPRNNAW